MECLSSFPIQNINLPKLCSICFLPTICIENFVYFLIEIPTESSYLNMVVLGSVDVALIVRRREYILDSVVVACS